ncbi:MAG: hypothetical protein QXL16_02565 [Candidatus Micrarchaeaceae archaeon]
MEESKNFQEEESLEEIRLKKSLLASLVNYVSNPTLKSLIKVILRVNKNRGNNEEIVICVNQDEKDELIKAAERRKKELNDSYAKELWERLRRYY